ncbi:hypothetical protein ACYSUO_23220 [Streptomyces sp. UC4497]
MPETDRFSWPLRVVELLNLGLDQIGHGRPGDVGARVLYGATCAALVEVELGGALHERASLHTEFSVAGDSVHAALAFMGTAKLELDANRYREAEAVLDAARITGWTGEHLRRLAKSGGE